MNSAAGSSAAHAAAGIPATIAIKATNAATGRPQAAWFLRSLLPAHTAKAS
jgi:hypothetical protein